MFQTVKSWSRWRWRQNNDSFHSLKLKNISGWISPSRHLIRTAPWKIVLHKLGTTEMWMGVLSCMIPSGRRKRSPFDLELDLGVHIIGNFWWKIDKVMNSLKTRSLIMSVPHDYMLRRGAVIIRYEIVLGCALYTKAFWRCFRNSFFVVWCKSFWVSFPLEL